MKKGVLSLFIMFNIFSYQIIFAEDSAVLSDESTKSETVADLENTEPKEKKVEVDEYLGFEYETVKSYNLESGNVKLLLKESTGSFNIYAKNEYGREIPLLANNEGFVSSFSSLKIGKNIYRLNKDASVSKSVRKLNDSCQLVYKVENKSQVVIDFSVISAFIDNNNADIIKVNVYVTNISENNRNMTFKSVYDTVLGEGSAYHFYTTSDKTIQSSKKITNIEECKSIISSNGDSSIQFVLFGNTVNKPEIVTLANKDSIVLGAWIPEIKEGESFNKILAYNNSSVCINWPSFDLNSKETQMFTYYIAVGVNGEKPLGVEYVNSLNPTEESVKSPKTMSLPVIEQEPVKNKTIFEPVEKTSVEFIVPPITDNQLDPVYIQGLIDKINSLQSDPENVDRDEIRRLNAELDSILKIIRQQ